MFGIASTISPSRAVSDKSFLSVALILLPYAAMIFPLTSRRRSKLMLPSSVS
jgi:hypothetical protein